MLVFQLSTIDGADLLQDGGGIWGVCPILHYFFVLWKGTRNEMCFDKFIRDGAGVEHVIYQSRFSVFFK